MSITLTQKLNDMLDMVDDLFDDYYDAIQISQEQENSRAEDKVREVRHSLSNLADDIKVALETVDHRAGL